MAANPVWATTPRIGVAAVSTANTARDGTGTLPTIITGVAAGTRIDRIAVVATADPADCTVTLFISDGSTIWYYDEVDCGNPAAASTTVPPFRWEKAYSGLILPGSAWLIKAGVTVSLTSGVFNVFCFGADLT